MKIARSRFDKMEPPSPEKAELQKVHEAVGHTNEHTVRFIDPAKDQNEALHDINLPSNTFYLIDKVVRAKASQGPIGVDNSELINIELERELRMRNRSLYPNEGHDDVDEANMTAQEHEDHVNEKLLQRLIQAANIEHDQKT